MKELRASAKEIAELFGSGNTTSESMLNLRAEEGQMIHKYWGKYQDTDLREVSFPKSLNMTVLLEVTAELMVSSKETAN